MIIITYVDDTLFFGPDLAAIEKVIAELEAAEYALTREAGDEDNVFSFSGVSITPNKSTNMLTLTQTGLIEKVLAAVGMYDCNTRGSPSTMTPLGTDTKGMHRKDSWNYASIIGMLMYLSSNAHPEIQFTVHKCAHFTHCPRSSHKEAIKHICRYLQGAKCQMVHYLHRIESHSYQVTSRIFLTELRVMMTLRIFGSSFSLEQSPSLRLLSY
jgi:hypothetical protein